MVWCETCSYKFGVMPRWLAVAFYHFGDISGYLSFCDDTLKRKAKKLRRWIVLI